MNPFEHIYSTEKAAKILGKSERQIQNLCNDGKLIARRLDPDNKKSPWMVYLPERRNKDA